MFALHDMPAPPPGRATCWCRPRRQQVTHLAREG